MQRGTLLGLVVCFVCVLQSISAAQDGGASAAGAAAAAIPPPPPPTTVWDRLGVPQSLKLVRGVRDAVVNRRGNRPQLERRPPLKAIADPANLESEIPAVKVAAEIKQAEDQAAQKKKAIRYLATIGCGCYDLDDGITDAIVDALKDCNADVRLVAIESLTEAAQGERCCHCKNNSCCKRAIVKQLQEMAYGQDKGCWKEPSPEIRAAAVGALQNCEPLEPEPAPAVPEVLPAPVINAPDPPVEEEPEDDETEADEDDEVPADEDDDSYYDDEDLSGEDELSDEDLESNGDESGDDERDKNGDELDDGDDVATRLRRKLGASSRKRPVTIELSSFVPPNGVRPTPHSSQIKSRRRSGRANQSSTAPKFTIHRGIVGKVDANSGLVRIDFDRSPQVGTNVEVFHKFLRGGLKSVGQLVVVRQVRSGVIARPISAQTQFSYVTSGDMAIARQTYASTPAVSKHAASKVALASYSVPCGPVPYAPAPSGTGCSCCMTPSTKSRVPNEYLLDVICRRMKAARFGCDSSCQNVCSTAEGFTYPSSYDTTWQPEYGADLSQDAAWPHHDQGEYSPLYEPPVESPGPSWQSPSEIIERPLLEAPVPMNDEVPLLEAPTITQGKTRAKNMPVAQGKHRAEGKHRAVRSVSLASPAKAKSNAKIQQVSHTTSPSIKKNKGRVGTKLYRGQVTTVNPKKNLGLVQFQEPVIIARSTSIRVTQMHNKKRETVEYVVVDSSPGKATIRCKTPGRGIQIRAGMKVAIVGGKE